jgi:hypothetical protein
MWEARRKIDMKRKLEIIEVTPGSNVSWFPDQDSDLDLLRRKQSVLPLDYRGKLSADCRAVTVHLGGDRGSRPSFTCPAAVGWPTRGSNPPEHDDSPLH